MISRLLNVKVGTADFLSLKQMSYMSGQGVVFVVVVVDVVDIFIVIKINSIEYK